MRFSAESRELSINHTKKILVMSPVSGRLKTLETDRTHLLPENDPLNIGSDSGSGSARGQPDNLRKRFCKSSNAYSLRGLQAQIIGAPRDHSAGHTMQINLRAHNDREARNGSE